MSKQSPLVITSMKNEGAFILEWIAYHRVIGFTEFLVYTNDCDDCTVAILERLQELGIVTHEANQVLRRGPHKSALKAAKEHALTRKADWIFISDIDEFLVVKIGDGTVQALIDHVPQDADVIPITWRLFSHNNHIEFQDKFVIEQYTDAEKSLDNGGLPDRFVKSLFRKAEGLEKFGIHGPKDAKDYVWRQPDGRRLGPDDNLTRPQTSFAYDVAQINHYAVGSVDSFLIKKDRGRANHWKQDLGMDYWQRLCRGGENETEILKKLPETKAEFDRFLEDAKLSKLHKEAVEWRKERIAALRNKPQFAKMRQSILNLSSVSKLKDIAEQLEKIPEEDVLNGIVDQEDIHRQLGALFKEVRSLVDRLSPHDCAEITLDRLDELEMGLLGRVQIELPN